MPKENTFLEKALLVQVETTKVRRILNFENSFKIGILTLMNTTTSSMYGFNDFNFYDLNFYTKAILIFFSNISLIT